MIYYENALDMDDKNTVFLMNKAQCYYDQNKFKLSIENLSKAHELAPVNPQILYKLGLSFYSND